MAINQNLIPARGVVPKPVIMNLVREITEADLAKLSTIAPTAPPPLKQARAIHHKQAQLLAEGYSVTEVAAQVGSTPARISLLKHDPTFSELIAFYSEQRAEIESETHKRIQTALVDVLELSVGEIQERLTDDIQRARISTDGLRKLAEFAADRTVAPPKATQQGSVAPPSKISFNFGLKKPETDQVTIDMETDD